MSNLLDTVGYRNLQKGMTWKEVDAAFTALAPLLEAEKREPRRYAVALAYLVGIRQGVHQERQRRRERGQIVHQNHLAQAISHFLAGISENGLRRILRLVQYICRKESMAGKDVEQ